ncbi:membrane fusion protein, cobalt-zinc-cadmium efflux system [Chitinophaga jiangningensis]|uniref:Membrane fusion protein, cobalt-zinc-cadmium efflux system n=1 Tax=Chitinophaga jiangningensis TaxID=1419482 RepID=A0A1M7KEB8_9BACT|nr:efflux RND transporter periplasmic adaptor subunit [Chitinophaga jiangningensis]SHM63680.1 membrane fusion protein, cobalt-zinc-cadmium efflux system [Chitinophaga jiangningensis]
MQTLFKTALVIYFLTALYACGNTVEPIRKQSWELNDSLLKRLEVDTAAVTPTAHQVSLTGKITANEDKMAQIFPMVSGIVTNVKVHSGDYVQKGQVLALIKSPEMATYTADQTISEKEMLTAKKNLEVAESFYTSGLNSQQEYETAKNEYDKAVAAWHKSSAIVDINGGAHQSTYAVKAPVPGFVIIKRAAENMQWRPDNSDPIFVVADLHNVWAIINIFESDIAGIREGDKVEMSTLSYPDKTFSGKIEKIYNVLDPENKVMKARVVIDNPGYLLKPEMFVSIKTQRHSDTSSISIPSRGIIFDKDKYFVLVLTDKKPGVAIREIKVASTVEGRAQVTAGLVAGDKIIASRQVFIYETLQDLQ